MINLLALGVAFLAIAYGHVMEGGSLDALVNLPAMLIVFGGTLAAALLQSDSKSVGRCMSLFPSVFINRKDPHQSSIEKIKQWSTLSRANGFLSLENDSNSEADKFLRRGLQMVVDGANARTIRKNLEIELYSYEEKGNAAAEVMESMGGYAPTLGIVGAVLGLIQVMLNMENSDLLGAGIATAFVATIYGVASANLFFLPVSFRMKNLVRLRGRYMEMLISGMEGLANGENPSAIEQRLQGYRV